MKLRFLLIPITAFCMISSCSSCGEGSGNGNGLGTNLNDSTNIGDNAIVDGGADKSELELLQHDMNLLIEKQMALAKNNSSKSKEVEGMLAGFELGMTKREVKKHMLRMKQKKHLVRVQKAKNVFEYVYQLKLASGKSNTYMDFDYSRKGGVYKAVCKPSLFKGISKAKFLNEVRDVLIDWYGGASFQLPSQKGCKRYIWIQGNRHVDLYCTSKGVELVYTDLLVELPKNIDGGGKERPNTDLLM